MVTIVLWTTFAVLTQSSSLMPGGPEISPTPSFISYRLTHGEWTHDYSGAPYYSIQDFLLKIEGQRSQKMDTASAAGFQTKHLNCKTLQYETQETDTSISEQSHSLWLETGAEDIHMINYSNKFCLNIWKYPIWLGRQYFGISEIPL